MSLIEAFAKGSKLPDSPAVAAEAEAAKEVRGAGDEVPPPSSQQSVQLVEAPGREAEPSGAEDVN